MDDLTFDTSNASFIHASDMKEHDMEDLGMTRSPVTKVTDCSLHYMHQMEYD